MDATKEREIIAQLRSLILDALPNCIERTAYGVPHFYLRSRVCFIWPTSVKGSGVPEDGVLLGFWKGHLIKHNAESFRGQSNRVVRFIVYQDVSEICMQDVCIWLEEAQQLDGLKSLCLSKQMTIRC